MSDHFMSRVRTVLTGAILAQAVTFLSSPILTRLYSPADFGAFSVFLSIASIGTLFATMRYDGAIIIAKTKTDVFRLLWLLAAISTLVALVTSGTMFLYAAEISVAFDHPEMQILLYFTPLAMIFIAWNQIIGQCLIRESRFNISARSRVYLSGTNSVVQILLSFTALKPLGMLLGTLAGNAIAITASIRSSNLKLPRFPGFSSLVSISSRFDNFPRYDLPAMLVNVAANQLPMIMLGIYFGPEFVGLYAVTQKVLMMPVGMISNAFLDVFRHQAALDVKENGECRSLYILTFKRLSVLAFFPLVILLLWGDALFSFVFGKQWEMAGQIAQIMAPMYFLNFIANPLSYTLYLYNKQRINMVGHLLFLFASILSITIAKITINTFAFTFSFSLLYSLIYTGYIYTGYRLSAGHKRSHHI